MDIQEQQLRPRMIYRDRKSNEKIETNMQVKLIYLIYLLLFSTTVGLENVIAQTDRPNVVIIFIDDLGYGDISSYGNKLINTPNIDNLADKGIKFTNFYVNSPICSPSRAALFTGKYPMFWKIHSYISDTKSNENRGMKNWLDPNAITMAKIFKENGYRTGHFGKWHLGGGRDVGNAPLPAEYGFDQALVSFEGLGDRILFKNESLSIASEKLGNGKITWVDKHKATEIYVDSTLSFIQRDLDKPFYVHLFPNDVHDPHLPIRASSNKFEKVARSHSEKDFFAVLERLDEQIGRFIYGLDELGKLDNTIIIFTSDNGPTDWPRYYNSGEIPPGSTGGFFGRKWSLYEGGIRMPFIISWPAKIPMGITDEQTIFSSIDLMPSLANLAGVKADFIGDGEDRGRALMGENDNNNRPIMWEYSSAFGGSILPGNDKHISPNLAIRRSQWKLLINVDSTGTELYNLDKDPFESRNVVQNNLDLAQELASIVIQWRRNFLIREIGK